MRITVTVRENQRGIRYRRGKYQGIAGPGKYLTAFGRGMEVMDFTKEATPEHCSIKRLSETTEAGEQMVFIRVADHQRAFHYIDGHYDGCLRSGLHGFWKEAGKHDFMLTDCSRPEVADDIPEYILSSLTEEDCVAVDVAAHEKGLLYLDNQFVRLLEPGRYYFWQTGVEIGSEILDTRRRMMEISGQEILTRDKVSLRLTMNCTYAITDVLLFRQNVEDCEEQIRLAAQLAIRAYVSGVTLDELLEGKEQMAARVLATLQEKEGIYAVEFYEAGVKDIILPGEYRSILNTVLLAEKQAQANVIARREEAAATRSLMNTAKLMDENNTLYRLKEMEYIERVCQFVGTINLNGGGSLLNQLAGVLGADGQQKGTER